MKYFRKSAVALLFFALTLFPYPGIKVEAHYLLVQPILADSDGDKPGEANGAVEGIYQPLWISTNNSITAEIMRAGFDGLSSSELIIGAKGEYFYDIPYSRILAAVIPDSEALIQHYNFSRWKANGAKAEQYFDLGQIPGVPDDIISPFSFHYNLCGVLVASTLIGEDPAYFIWSTMALEPWSRDFYSDPGQGTNKFQLMDIFEDFHWDVLDDSSESIRNQCSSSIKPGPFDRVGTSLLCQMASGLNAGWVPVFGANLWANENRGILVSPDYYPASDNRYAPHWVAVLQVISSNDGFSYVRIYNPFQNREEVYTWNDFYAAYQMGSQELIRDYFLVHP